MLQKMILFLSIHWHLVVQAVGYRPIEREYYLRNYWYDMYSTNN